MRLDNINFANLSGLEKVAMVVGLVGLLVGGYWILRRSLQNL